MVGEPSRAAPELEFALGGRDFQGDTGRAWLVGDVPFNAFAQAISASRINLEHHAPLARERHRLVVVPAVRARRSAAPRSSRTRTRGSSAGSSPGSELLVVNDADEALAAYRELLDDPAQAEAMGAARARARPRRAHRTRIARGSCSRWSDSVPRRACVPERRRVAIVPARNEEGAVGRVVEELRAFDPELDVLVIDDGSEDATAASAAAAGAVVVRLPFNLGIGGAVQTGFKYALEQGYDTVIRLDGDGQHDPQEIPQLLAPLARGEADVVVGSRFANGSDGDYRPPFASRAGIRWFAQLVSLLTRQKLTDTTSGFQARERARRSGSSPPTIRTTTRRWRRP